MHKLRVLLPAEKLKVFDDLEGAKDLDGVGAEGIDAKKYLNGYCESCDWQVLRDIILLSRLILVSHVGY